MSKIPRKGVYETRSSGLRYSLPDEIDTALGDLGVMGLVDLFHKILQIPDRPLGLLPSLADMVQFLGEAVALVCSALDEPHPVRPEPNPEVLSTGQVVPAKELVTTKKSHRDSASRTLGLSPTDTADDVELVSHVDAGSPESRKIRARQEILGSKEPLSFYRLLKEFENLLARLDPSSDSYPAALRLAGRIADWFQGIPQSLGKPGNRASRPRSSVPSIASAASAFRRLKRQKGSR